MTVKELIDFHLSIQQPGALIGFSELYADRIDELKQAIQDHYGSQEAWLALSEDTELPDPIQSRASKLVRLYDDWKEQR